MKMKGINRRKFMVLASAGTAATYLELSGAAARAMMGGGMAGGGMGGGGMSGSVTVIDPSPGPAFADLPEAPKSGTEYEITVQQSSVRLGSTNANLLTYNGMYPGPVMRAEKNGTLEVCLKNNLPKTSATNLLGHQRNITNLHTHGLHVTPNSPGDNVMVQLRPGEEYHYSYDLRYESAGHLNFYHPHVHGTVAEQYWGGLAGPLVIGDGADSPLSGFQTHIMMVKDITLSGSAPAAYSTMSDYMRGKEGNIVTVNGQVNPVLQIAPGQVQRWQIVNACNARYLKLSLDKHTMHVIGTDGGLVDQSYPLTQILVAPGERIDVLVQGTQGTGTFKLLSLPYDRGMNALQQVTLLTLKYGKGPSASDVIPSAINRDAVRPAFDLAPLERRQLTLSMMMGKGYINGQSFVDMDHSYTVMSKLGEYEVWEILNQSGMDHPFHQHVNACQVLSTTGGDRDYADLYTKIPAWKDVVNIPKMGSATVLMPVMDWEGMSMFHCHIIEHEDIGMMGMWHIMDGM
ncbi:multicopper oxidase family protein [Geomonas sp. RF6]|uniref:multicopper oxidase family protein n=1 Tax=Geomonas sp. RF6 TaxID=2897342 RepID=UPI001E6589DD|nr:multicopper oxidase family protein [Geomonas sp. RF6]UFS72757.1 multicopper oxidase family protein [Geomonas sp. RF6]